MSMNDKQHHASDKDETLARLVRGGGDLFGYHVRSRQGLFSPAIAQRYGHPEIIDNLPEWMVEHGQVQPGNSGDWLAFFDAIDRGEKQGSVRVPMRSADGGYGWFWLRFDSFSDEEGRPLFATVSFEDYGREQEENRLRSQDISGLLKVTRKTFPDLMTLNLTRGTYRVISFHREEAGVLPRGGTLDGLLRLLLTHVAEEDRESVADAFSPKALEDAFLHGGKESVQLVYRRVTGDGGLAWHETTIMGQDNEFDDDTLLAAMSRPIDSQKAEEIRLREKIWLQAEELRVTISNSGHTICYYDVPTKTLTVPPGYARDHDMPEVIVDYPANISQAAREYYPETPAILRRFCDSMLRGDPSGSCEVPFKIPGRADAVWKRMYYAMVYDREGLPRRAVIFVEDITAQRLQARENQRLKENEQVLRLIAQHSDRVVCHYDVQSETARPWDKDTCKRCQVPRLCEMSVSDMLENSDIAPEGIEALRAMFADIRGGSPQGSLKFRVRKPGQDHRWFDMRYSTIFDNGDNPVSALISHKDITEQVEHELTYLRHVQTLRDSKTHLGVLEADLDTGVIEAQGGRMLPPGTSAVGSSLDRFANMMVASKMLVDDRAEAIRFFSRSYLKSQHAAGNRRLEREWRMNLRDGAAGWVHIEADLMTDPYSGHLKVFFHLTDITEEKNAQLEIQNRSERDGMTGLLNRATAEARVRQLLSERNSAGILLLLDLDDLKSINDNLGHSEGDRAILGIAGALRFHFRESDVIARVGGDEFMVYLPGAAINRDAIAASVSNLLRKLADIPIGADNKQRIHCSIGCASQTAEGQSYESLFKQADVALYHVKRSGKNNFAFYSPDMAAADYQFQSQRLLTLQSEKKFEMAELQYLLDAISDFYQLVLSMNLSTNDYFLMEEVKEGVFAKLPPFGFMDDFVDLTVKGIHPDDAPGFLERLSRESLLDAYGRGETSARHYFRFYKDGEYQWTEASVIFYTNEKGDVCDFTLVRWAAERAYELEQFWLHKVLELAVKSSFEYICLINVDTGHYSLYGDEENTHAVSASGDFDAVTRGIRDNLIAPGEREAYYEQARLSTVAARMGAGGQSYTYRYRLADGEREAAFHWFEPTHTQLLMTVQRR